MLKKIENLLTYKRLCSNRKSYYYLLEYLRDKEKKQRESLRAASQHKQPKQYEKKRQQLNNVRNYSTYVVKPKDTDIVIWGSNLSSTAGRVRFTKIVKNMIVLPPYQKSVMIGILLSDGHLSSSKTHENPHLTFKQGIKNSSYVWFVYFILSHYCNVYPCLSKSIRKDKVDIALYLEDYLVLMN